MGKLLKWIVAGATGAVALIASFLIPPTLFECHLFTDCHQNSLGYAFLSLFMSEAQEALSHEQLALQIAHSLSFTLIGLLLGFLIGLSLELYRRRYAIPAPAIADAATTGTGLATNFAGPNVVASVRSAQLEMLGLDGFGDYYLKIDISELAQMPRGLSVGRDSVDAEMVIGHETVSRRHARLFAHDATFMLEDVGSTNGTKINGRSLRPDEPSRLRSGDRVDLGSVNFKVVVN